MDSHSVNTGSVLPQDLWTKIFKFLSQKDLLKASAVCKEFNTHALDPILWKTLDLEISYYKLVSHQNLLRRCTGLLKLQLGSSHLGAFGCMAENAMASLVDILTASCKQLRTVHTINTPYLRQHKIIQLIKSTNCSVNQTTHHIHGHGLCGAGFETTTFDGKQKQIEFHQVGTTDYYRKGNPYNILRNPGSSIISFIFKISVERLSSVTISLNHCRTTGDGIVCMTVNGKPADPREDGTFAKKLILAPRYDFGWESFPVCLKLLQEGLNKITLCLDSSSPGVYWVSDTKLETVFS